MVVPRYEYRCRACGDPFERTRPMSESSAPCPCPQGHGDTVKLLSTVAVGGRAGSQAPGPQGGGGCCGGACGCGRRPPRPPPNTPSPQKPPPSPPHKRPLSVGR